MISRDDLPPTPEWTVPVRPDPKPKPLTIGEHIILGAE